MEWTTLSNTLIMNISIQRKPTFWEGTVWRAWRGIRMGIFLLLSSFSPLLFTACVMQFTLIHFIIASVHSVSRIWSRVEETLSLREKRRANDEKEQKSDAQYGQGNKREYIWTHSWRHHIVIDDSLGEESLDIFEQYWKKWGLPFVECASRQKR